MLRRSKLFYINAIIGSRQEQSKLSLGTIDRKVCFDRGELARLWSGADKSYIAKPEYIFPGFLRAERGEGGVPPQGYD